MCLQLLAYFLNSIIEHLFNPLIGSRETDMECDSWAGNKFKW